VNASRPIFGGAVKATEVRDHRSHYDEAKIDGATEQEVLGRNSFAELPSCRLATC
jgi:hypothetical protein